MRRGATYTRPFFCPPRVHMVDFKNRRRAFLARCFDRLFYSAFYSKETP